MFKNSERVLAVSSFSSSCPAMPVRFSLFFRRYILHEIKTVQVVPFFLQKEDTPILHSFHITFLLAYTNNSSCS